MFIQQVFSQRGEDKDAKTFISQNVRKITQKRDQKLSQYVSMVLFSLRRAAPILGCLPVGMEGKMKGNWLNGGAAGSDGW